MINIFLLSFVAASEAQMCPGTVFADAERMDFINYHNSYRSQVALGRYAVGGTYAPTAANMYQINWDCELESYAQEYANSCPTAPTIAGENIYYSYSTYPTSTSGLGATCTTSWFNQFQEYGFSVTYTYGSYNYYATQACWASTTYMGCGAASCPSSDPSLPYLTTVVCLYSPPGNTPGAAIYNEGPPCSQCTYGYDLSTGLCTYTVAEVPVQPVQPIIVVYPKDQGDDHHDGHDDHDDHDDHNNDNDENPLGIIPKVISQLLPGKTGGH